MRLNQGGNVQGGGGGLGGISNEMIPPKPGSSYFARHCPTGISVVGSLSTLDSLLFLRILDF